MHPTFLHPLILAIFGLGYLAIIFEYTIKVNKTSVALFIAVLCWAAYFVGGNISVDAGMGELNKHVANVSQIIFFLLGAMTIVELIDSHKGFKVVTEVISTTSKRKMLWMIAGITFFLSATLDNLTTTILMISLLRKIIPNRGDRLLLSCLVVPAANAGGAWTPIGDVTTTMLWINGQISSWSIMQSLFLPSIVSLLVPLLYFSFRAKGEYPSNQGAGVESISEPGSRLVFYMGIGALITVPLFKAVTGLPPFMGVLIGLAALWLITDILHFRYEHRQHLRVPSVLTRIDISGILFFLGILLCINALEAAGLLDRLAVWLDQTISNQVAIATLIGLLSAIVDNVPLVAGTMGMYPIAEYLPDSLLWHMIAYAAGTGGSLLLIGSSSGVALMGMEKVDFVYYMKKMTLPVLVGYFAGIGIYLLQAMVF